MDLESNMLSEISQKKTNSVGSHLCVAHENDTHTRTHTHTHTHTRKTELTEIENWWLPEAGQR